MEQTEHDLIAAAQKADANAFARLYDVYRERIYRYVYYRTHHRETAEDVTAQVFLRAWERVRSYDAARGTFSAWIYRIAHNLVIDHYRALRPSSDVEDIWDVLSDGRDVVRDMETRERLAQVEKHIRALPSAQREIVLLRVWDQLSYAEIAALTGKTESACKMAFSRGLAVLRAQMPILLLAFVCLSHFI